MEPQEEQKNTNISEPDSGTKKNLEQEIVSKITEAKNILVALSGDSSVDEMAAAVGLTIYFNRIGKKGTAIYSGLMPNALNFLKPEKTFDTSADVLQDFVITLNKEKADHLRYKIDGEYVKVFITPFKERIAQEDLEFYYGDYNVDLVIALDVLNGIDLDEALREHGRIMHDAVVINVTTGKPGKFGEIEWSNLAASSVSEMLAGLIYKMNHKVGMEKEEATAFLTGIVAATNRFANARTTAATMRMASRLIESGANQQLIAKNVTENVDNEMYSLDSNDNAEKKADGTLKVANEDGNTEIGTNVNEEKSTLLDDLKAAEASLAEAGAEILPEEGNEQLKIEDGREVVEAAEPATMGVAEPAVVETAEPTGSAAVATEPVGPVAVAEEKVESELMMKGEKVIPVPEENSATGSFETESEKYGRMLKEALAGENPAVMSAPVVAPETVEAVPEMDFGSVPEEQTIAGSQTNANMPGAAMAQENMGAMVQENVGAVVPQENVGAMPAEEILPTPPAPIVPNGPAMPDGTTFQIPGM